MDCLFCKIINGDIPCSKVYEDDKVLAFNDIEPQAPVHILIIPKEHIKSAAEIDESNSALIAHVFEVASKIAKDMRLDGFRIVNNCGDPPCFCFWDYSPVILPYLQSIFRLRVISNIFFCIFCLCFM